MSELHLRSCIHRAMSELHLLSGERVQDIAFWKSELNNEINSVETEYKNLEVSSPGHGGVAVL